MPTITRHEVVDPKALSPEQRERLIDELYAINSTIFAVPGHGGRDAFAGFALGGEEYTRILLHRSAAGEAVGFLTAHAYECSRDGRPSVVFRCTAATLRAYRGGGGGGGNVRFGLAFVAEYLLRHPGRDAYYLGAVIHPSSYLLLLRHVPAVWPSRERPGNDETGRFIAELGDSFGLQRAGADPLVRHIGAFTRDTDAEAAYWQRCEKPAARYFVERNPGYREGDGLLCLCTVDARMLAQAGVQAVRDQARRQRDAVLARVYRNPVASRVLLPREVRRRLRAAPLFAGLDDERIERLAQSAEVQPVRAGEVILRAGDAGDELYVIDRGAVYVLAQGLDGDEQVLDQLDAGAVFGEIALLTNERRTATVRAATAATLLRVRRDALTELMAADRQVRDAIWGWFAERRFDEAARTVPAFARFARAERVACLRRGESIELPAGGSAGLPGGAHLFVLTGEVEITLGGAKVQARAPVVVDACEPVHLRAAVASKVYRVRASADA